MLRNYKYIKSQCLTTQLRKSWNGLDIICTLRSATGKQARMKETKYGQYLGLWVGKFIRIFPEIFGNLLISITHVNQMFSSPALQGDPVKQACSWQTSLQIFML